jgi:hypothetical protein
MRSRRESAQHEYAQFGRELLAYERRREQLRTTYDVARNNMEEHS